MNTQKDSPLSLAGKVEDGNFGSEFLKTAPVRVSLYFSGSGPVDECGSITFPLNPVQHQNLKEFTHKHTPGISNLFTAIWAALISRYADQGDITLFSIPASDAEESGPVFPLKVSMEKETVLQGLLAQITARKDEMKGHPPCTLSQIAEWAASEAGTGAKSGIAAIREVKAEPDSDRQTRNLHRNISPLDLVLSYDPDDLSRFTLTFSGKLEEWYIRQIGDHFITLLEGILAGPETALSSIPLLTPAEEKHILFELNDSDVPYREDMTIHRIFEEQVLKTPDNIAVVYRNESMTYRDLNERANRLAHAIRTHYFHQNGEDILPDTLIGICMDRSIFLPVAMLGILKAGCAYVPIDPAYPTERLRFIVDDAEVPLVVTEQALLEKLLFLYEKDYGVISLDGGWEFIKKFPAENPQPISGPDNLAYVIYTSGSTGRPKGAMIEHRCVVSYYANEVKRGNLDSTHRRLQFPSINFDDAVADYFPTLLTGGALYIAHEEIRKDPEALVEYMRDNEITGATLTPAVHRLMPRVELPSLKVLVLGGDIPDPDSVRFWRTRCRLINEYGPTECTVGTLELMFGEEHQYNEIGTLNDNMKAYILDANRNPVPIGVAGELYIGGVGVGRGYLKRPELTAERFIPNPFITGEEQARGRNLRLYKSGDRVRWLKTGSVEFLGRVDFQVKIRGFRIEPSEIESVLSTHSEIMQCAVTAYDDGTEKRLAAYYVPVEGTTPAVTDLKAHLAELLPDYMIPSAFMELKEMPLSPSGKMERRLLPPPTPGLLCSRGPAPAEYIPPQTSHEIVVSNVLRAIMNLDQISIDSDIFDLGAHSLMAARIASDLRKQLSQKVVIKDIFDHRTIRKIAAFLAGKSEVEHEETVTIPRVLHRERIPLTFQQEQIWFLSKLVPNNRAYNFQVSVRFKGDLKKEILTRCLDEMIRRHEVLRTTFHESAGGPVQKVHAPWKAVIAEVDLTHLVPEEREAEVASLIEHEVSQAFDFTRLPLAKWALYKLAEDEHIFFHMEHHFLHDGWEMALFFKELKELYLAFSEGKESPLPPLPIQYADYAIWHRQYLSGARLEEKVNYWIDRIKDYPQVLNLPTDHPRPPVQSFNGGLIRFDMDRELYQSLREFSRAHKATLFNTMYSAFAVLLSRYCRQQQFLVGTGVANRNVKETEGLMGMFVNTVLLHSDLTGNPTFLEFLETTKESMLRDSEHYDTPFMHIVEQLKAGNSPGRNPLFQVLFAFHDNPVPLLEFPSFSGKFIETHNSTAKADINLICLPRAEQHASEKDGSRKDEDVTLMWEYNTDLFDRETMQGMLDHYLAMLRAFVKTPHTRVHDSEILLPHEREQILTSFNDTRLEYDSRKTLVELFEEQVRKQPAKTAVIHNGEKLSYRELNERANRWAHHLRRMYREKFSTALPPNATVGISVERNIDMVTGILAVVKAGGAYVPLNPHNPENRLRFILDDASIFVVLTTQDIAQQLPFLGDGRRLVLNLDNRDLSGEPATDPPGAVRPEDWVYIIYTSGSTGNPKGVCIPHRAVHNYVVTARKEFISDNDVVAQVSNYAFDASVFEIWGTLLIGGTLAIIDKDKLENLELLKEEFTKQHVTASFFTTALFNAILESDREIITRLHTVIFGGEAANVDIVRRLIKVKPQNLNIVHAYGPTECTCYSTYCLLTEKYKESDILPIGKPLYNYTAYVLDEKGVPVPIGVPGELHIGGDSLAAEYLNRPELTAEKFIENPFATAEERRTGRNTKLYRTGDLVRWLPDGNIVFMGRTDFQVKIRGFRIEPEEIEATLLKHPAVKQCVVIPWERMHLIAYWVPQNEVVTETQEDLKLFLSRILPEFMVPAAFIRLREFKLNSNFKIDRSSLPAPKMEKLMSRRDYAAPTTLTEGILAEIWKELLKIDRVSVNDSFFELGGNSILTVRMLSSIKKRLGVDVNVARMFAQPTIASLAAFIDGRGIAAETAENNLSLALKDAETGIEVQNASAVAAQKPEAVLLTGVTGFLGLYLLNSLISRTQAVVYCIVRGKDQDDIRERFEETIAVYGKDHLKNHPRVHLVKGDLADSNLGMDDGTVDMLKETIDRIYHCGAMVHHMYDYGTMRKSNVLSTVELLKIAAAGKKKTFNFISTLGTASVRDDKGRLLEIETGDSPLSTNGYNLSKWVSERILSRVAGMDINIFRPGNITGDSRTGACPPDKNHALLLMKGCIQMGAAPNWHRTVEMLPVDILSDAIVELAETSHGFNIYNMNNPHEISWHRYMDIVKSTGFSIRLLPMNIWKEKHLMNADEKNAIFALREYYTKERKDIITREWKPFAGFNSREVRERLKHAGIHYPGKYDDYLTTILEYLMKTEFLPSNAKTEGVEKHTREVAHV